MRFVRRALDGVPATPAIDRFTADDRRAFVRLLAKVALADALATLERDRDTSAEQGEPSHVALRLAERQP